MNLQICYPVLILISTSVFAQDQPIEQITVTAARGSQNILDVAGNISWLDDESLRNNW